MIALEAVGVHQRDLTGAGDDYYRLFFSAQGEKEENMKSAAEEGYIPEDRLERNSHER